MQTQLQFPIDKGRRNALENILLAVEDELRRQEAVITELVGFSVEKLPELIQRRGPFNLLSADVSSAVPISPYPFGKHDLLRRRPQTSLFTSADEVINNLNISAIARLFENTELIGIDESKIDIPLPHSSVTFLKSAAFRMYRDQQNNPDEAAGPFVSRLEISSSDDNENRHQLMGYIRNYYIAYLSAITSLAAGRRPRVVLHGPLVRAIAPFSRIVFDVTEARNLLDLDEEASGDFQTPSGSTEVFTKDSATEHNLSGNPQKVSKGEQNLKDFHQFCRQKCGLLCNTVPALTGVDRDGQVPNHARIIPKEADNESEDAYKRRRYPGFCLYFWTLRSLFDMSRITKTPVASAVEDISSATEGIRVILPSLMDDANVKREIRASLQNTLRQTGTTAPAQNENRRQAYELTPRLIKQLKLTDSGMMTYLLDEGEYTAPVQIYRYRTKADHNDLFRDGVLGIENDFGKILEKLFSHNPSQGKDKHPGYRILMSYVRTSPAREPVRFEYFYTPQEGADPKIEHWEALAPLFALSIPYQDYGLPLILYYADKIARTPTKLIRNVLDYEYLDLILKKRYTDPILLYQILGRLTRGYMQREGIR